MSPYREPWENPRHMINKNYIIGLIVVNALALVGLLALTLTTDDPSTPPKCRDSARLFVTPQGREGLHVFDEFDCHPDALLAPTLLGNNVLLTCTCMVWRGEPIALVNEGTRP